MTVVGAMLSVEAGSAGVFGLTYLRQQLIFSALGLECEGQMRKKGKPDNKQILLNRCPRIQVSAPRIAHQTFDLKVDRFSL